MNILITGTRTGIGLELSKRFLSNGNLVIGISRGRSSIEHDNYQHFQVDITDEKSVQAFVYKLKKAQLKIDTLINNAGIAKMNHLFLTPFKSVSEIFNVNFFGTFLLCREIGKIMALSKHGRIINLSSIAAPLNIEGESIYAASKAAVESFSKTIAKELQSFNITVNTVGPGPVETALTKGVKRDNIKKIINQQIFKKKNTFDDIYDIVEFISSDEAKMITGHNFYIGGI